MIQTDFAVNLTSFVPALNHALRRVGLPSFREAAAATGGAGDVDESRALYEECHDLAPGWGEAGDA